jgi:hypothetical protein
MPDIDFSDIPALDDQKGLETYLGNEALAAQGLQPAPQGQPQEAPQQQAQPAPQEGQPQAQPQAQQQQYPNISGINVGQMSREQLMQAVAQAQAMGLIPQQQQQPQPQRQGYTPQEQAFINEAIRRGYPLDRIQDAIAQRRGNPQNQANAAIAQRIANLENYLRTQEYRQAETAFIGKLTDFGAKWGLSESDLVAFGTAAAEKGINIAMPDADLETVFRAVYPEQYAIRSRRMSQASGHSQLYGGANVSDGGMAQSNRATDAYVEAYLAKTMPGYYKPDSK